MRPIDDLDCSHQFRRVIRKISRYVEQDHIRLQNEICEAMADLADGHVAIRVFVAMCGRDPRAMAMTGAHSFVIFQDALIIARINLWFETSILIENVTQRYNEYFSVGVCHNHNFDFFTIGLWGPGYQSDFFESNADLSNFSIGDIVDTHNIWSLTLFEGRSIFVPRNTHFHTQYAPSEFSISLNIIPKMSISNTAAQYIIDGQSKAVKRIIAPNSDQFG